MASTPEHLPRRVNTLNSGISHPQIRRVHTLPPKFSAPEFSKAKEEAQVTHLFETDFAKVVAFQVPLLAAQKDGGSRGDKSRSSSRRTSRSSSIGGDFVVNGAQSPAAEHVGRQYPWVSSTERTVAAGPLRVYRVSNTGVSFLNSGDFLRPMLSRSQCWCVSETPASSIFVLRARDDAFYRIELSSGNPALQNSIDKFKATLSSLLRYENTPCPFREGYNVVEEEHPPTVVTPVRRWSGRGSIGKAKKWKLNKIWEPEDGVWIRPPQPELDLALSMTPSPTKSEGAAVGEGSPLKLFLGFESKQSLLQRRGKDMNTVAGAETVSSSAQYSPISPGTAIPTMSNTAVTYTLPPNPNVMTEVESSNTQNFESMLPPSFKHVRSVTAPSDLAKLSAFISIPESNQSLAEETAGVDLSNSFSSDHDSFYSAKEYNNDEAGEIETFRTPSIAVSSSTEMSPPETPRPMKYSFVQDPDTPRLTHSSASEQINASLSTASGILAPVDAEISGLRPRKQFPPIHISSPSPSNTPDTPHTPELPISQPLSILSPVFPSPSKNTQSSIANSTIIQKACALLVGTPAYLVIMMLRIAARILRKLPGGEKGLELLTLHVPGGWDPDWDEEDDEDDFGFPLGNGRSAGSRDVDAVGTDVGGMGDDEVE